LRSRIIVKNYMHLEDRAQTFILQRRPISTVLILILHRPPAGFYVRTLIVLRQSQVPDLYLGLSTPIGGLCAILAYRVL